MLYVVRDAPVTYRTSSSAIRTRVVKAQVVDRRKLEAALSQLPVRISARPSELDRYLSTEIWLQQWAAAHRMFAH